MTTKFSQSDWDRFLRALFTSKARAAVLRIFMLDPSRAYYQRQIEAATGLALRAVQRELERLTSVDLLYRRLEGNRAYYQADMDFPLFPELRNIFLKASDESDALRGNLALNTSVRMLFLCESENRALVVTEGETAGDYEISTDYELEVMSSPQFESALRDNRPVLEAFLKRGVDLLGRRDDVIWRRIELSGFQVEKGKGIP